MSRFLVTILLPLFCTTLVSAAVCPPAEALSPCKCEEATLTIKCDYIPGRFDIKAVFDRATPFIDESIIFNELFIREVSLFEIPENAIPHLKFKNINMMMNRGLDYISPNAFNATYAVTEDLSLWNNALMTEAPYERDLFDFFNKFTKVTKIWLPGNRITSIPDNAFTQNANLKQLYFGSNNIQTIGAYPFTQLTNLGDLWISHNNVAAERTSPDAFKSLSSSLQIDLYYNSGINYLDETIFKPALDSALSIKIGGSRCGHNGCTYVKLTCDSRADWICPNAETYKDKLFGFRCSGAGPQNVFEYCESLGISGRHARKLI